MIEPARIVKQGGVTYPCYIGAGILAQLGEIVDGIRGAGKVIVISSPVVDSLYGAAIEAAIPSAVRLTMPDGEEEKTLQTAARLLDQMLQLPVRRDSLAVLAGGGVVGDAAGFACSIALRGISFVHVPTTLLAQVDSSIGGKVGVNHATGKNLIGTFAAPRAVVSDVATLATLPPREIRSGLYEALKAGVIGDVELFESIEAKRGDVRSDDRLFFIDVVRRSVDVKAAIVSADEREADLRRLLNYGHTVAHAIETATGFRMLSHGEAVGWGIVAANAIAVRRRILGAAEAARIDRAVIEGGAESLPALDAAELVRLTGADKKFTEAKKVMVLPRRIGECVIVDDITADDIRYGVDAMLSASR